ncbi:MULTISPECIES: hypothetical protein [Desulfosporosinus]|uniref:Uncharacterized protein n=1 Tax=Desulfosporosinus metallidurans TaxID=1888891 RepID=A0A1Q8QJS7_9FIRM|nr:MULTISPECIES: hypothetical protein [Desulfosporosinus]OLN27585.1 hypothetical protein DSOL_4460 [Desulfosporosinus metallidurans]
MRFGRIYDILKSKRGTSFPLVVAVTLALVIVFCGVTESIRLMIVAQGVRDAVQSAVISTINDNYDNVYHGEREGYSGAYQPSASNFQESLDYGDIYGRLDHLLGLRQENGYHVKDAGDDMEFRLSGLSVDLDNMPLAPASPDNSKGLQADAAIKLEVPVSFGGKSLPPMVINLRVKAKYIPIF